MSDTYDTVFQTQDLEGTLHWLGDQESRDRLDNVYTKTESDDAFRRIDDSYSSNDINDMFMSKADKADVYTISETDTLLSDLEDRTRTTFANIHATFVQFQSDVDVHFQAIEDDIDALPDTYYNKTEVDAIAEELDRTKQNLLHPDSSIIMTQRSDGSYDIGTASGNQIIDDTSVADDRVWSAEKSSTEFSNVASTASSELSSAVTSLSTSQSEVDSTQSSEIASLSTAESELGSEITRFESEVASDYIQVGDVDTDKGLYATSTSAYVKVDGTTIDFNSSGELELDGGISSGSFTVGTLPTGISSCSISYKKYGHIVVCGVNVATTAAGSHTIPVTWNWTPLNTGANNKQFLGYYINGSGEATGEMWINSTSLTIYTYTNSQYLGQLIMLV